jgi:hypothetical protein
MHLWRLIPRHLDHPNWRMSTRIEPIVVRAPTISRARGLAADAFERRIVDDGDQTIILSPWLTLDLVEVVEIATGERPPEEVAEVVEPPGISPPPRRGPRR